MSPRVLAGAGFGTQLNVDGTEMFNTAPLNVVRVETWCVNILKITELINNDVLVQILVPTRVTPQTFCNFTA